jgi:hypothetical protein
MILKTKIVAPRLDALPAKVQGAIALGLTRGGGVVRTQVRRELATTTGLKAGRVGELTPSKSASPGNLRYEIYGIGYPNDARYLASKPKLSTKTKAGIIYRNMGAGDAHHKFVLPASGSLSAKLWTAKAWSQAKAADAPGGAKLRRAPDKASRFRIIYAANIAHEIAGTNPKTGARVQVFFLAKANELVPPRVIEQLVRVLG